MPQQTTRSMATQLSDVDYITTLQARVKVLYFLSANFLIQNLHIQSTYCTHFILYDKLIAQQCRHQGLCIILSFFIFYFIFYVCNLIFVIHTARNQKLRMQIFYLDLLIASAPRLATRLFHISFVFFVLCLFYFLGHGAQ